MVNGGGASFGGTTGAQQIFPGASGGGYGTTAQQAGAAVPNGGGSRFGGLLRRGAGGVGRGAAALGGALMGAGAVGAMAGAFPNMVETDYTANRLAMTNGTYDKYGTSRRMLQYTEAAYRDDADRQQGLLSLRRGGFQENTAGFGALAGGARMASLLDPKRGYAGGAQVQMQLQDPALFNQLRMLTGVTTLNRGGQPRDIGQVARDIVTSGTGSNQPMSSAQLAASSGTLGGLTRQMQAANMSPEMQQTIIDYLQRAAETGSYEAADQQLRRPGTPRGSGSDTALQRQNTQTSAEQEVITALLKPTMDAYSKIMTATTAATRELADLIQNLPEAVQAAIGGEHRSLRRGQGRARWRRGQQRGRRRRRRPGRRGCSPRHQPGGRTRCGTSCGRRCCGSRHGALHPRGGLGTGRRRGRSTRASTASRTPTAARACSPSARGRPRGSTASAASSATARPFGGPQESGDGLGWRSNFGGHAGWGGISQPGDGRQPRARPRDRCRREASWDVAARPTSGSTAHGRFRPAAPDRSTVVRQSRDALRQPVVPRDG